VNGKLLRSRSISRPALLGWYLTLFFVLPSSSFQRANNTAEGKMTSLWNKAVPGVSGLSSVPSIAFVTSKILAVSEDAITCDDARSKCGKILLFDSDTGTLKRTITWIAPLELRKFVTQPEILPIRSDQFLVKTANEVRLFSDDGEELKKRHLPLEGVPATYNPELTLWSHWQLATSPDGRVALLTLHRAIPNEAEEHWISVDTLEDETVEKAPSIRCCVSINDNSVVFDLDGSKGGVIAIREKGKGSRAICDTCLGRDPIFIDSDHILANTRPGASFAVMATSGHVEYRVSLGDRNDFIIHRSAAPAAQRIAFVWSASTFRPEKMGAGEYHVNVFDLAKRIPVAETRIPEQAQKIASFTSIVSPTVALALDGSKLAILHNSSLRVFSVAQYAMHH
jgi:hypothetical protein